MPLFEHDEDLDILHALQVEFVERRVWRDGFPLPARAREHGVYDRGHVVRR